MPSSRTLRLPVALAILMNESRLSIEHLDDLHDHLQRLGTSFGATFDVSQIDQQTSVPFPYITQAMLTSSPVGYTLPDVIDLYNQHYRLLNLPLTILALQIAALMLFFVLMIVTLLIDSRKRRSPNYITGEVVADKS